MKYVEILAIAVLMLTLGGCVLTQAGRGTAQVPESSVYEGGGRDWLREIDRVLALPDDRQEEVLKQRQDAYLASPDTESRLDLALLRALGSDKVHDRDAALSLLVEIEPLQTTGREATLIALLRQLLEEQQAIQARLHQERKTLAMREARIKELETQLEAVTSIEQSIKQRQKALQGVKP